MTRSEINRRWVYTARRAWLEGKHEEAERLLKEGLRATGNDGYVALCYARMLAHQGHLQRADQMFKVAEAKLPDEKYKDQARVELAVLRGTKETPTSRRSEVEPFPVDLPGAPSRFGCAFWLQLLLAPLVVALVAGLVLLRIERQAFEPKMSTPLSSLVAVARQAETAKATMLADRRQGQALFEQLLKDHPTDGMVYFKRAETYEALGDSRLAAADYRRALALFPNERWKEKARAGLRRVDH